MKEEKELTEKDTRDMEEEDKTEHVERLAYVVERLELIDANEAENKAE